MAVDLEQRIVNLYDDTLSKFPHVSNLMINQANFEQCLRVIYENKNYRDDDLDQAHNKLIGNIVFSNVFPDYIEAKSYIVYPHFHVNTYFTNPAFIHKDKYSLEKSVIIGKKQQLNFFLTNSKFRGNLNLRFMRVLTIERTIVAPNITCYKLLLNAVPTRAYYDSYGELVDKKNIKMIKDEEYDWYCSKAISEVLKSNEYLEEKSILEGEFILCDEDYEDFKQMIKNRYGITFNDTFITCENEEKSMWLPIGFQRYDNRMIVNLNGKDAIIPLSLQKKWNKKRD